MQTLAVVLNSFAELDVSNPTLLEISKQILLKKIDLKATAPDGKTLIRDVRETSLKPMDSAMFMSAYSRAEVFNDPAL